jgi:hypothetical protein
MRHTQPTTDQIREWESWLAKRPAAIRATVTRLKIDPWTLYRLKTTDQRVFLLALFEPKADGKVLCRVAVSGDFNLLAFERSVFGIDPEDLEECDLPGPEEPVGALDLPVAIIKGLLEKYPTGTPAEVMRDLIAHYPLKKPGGPR